MEYQYPEFSQLILFANELLRMIDEGESLSVRDVCEHIESGFIVEFVYTQCGFKDLNVTVDGVRKVNDILKNHFVVSENEARGKGINKNGLLFILWLVLEEFSQTFFTMKENGIDPWKYMQGFC